MLFDCRHRAVFFARNSGACLDIADLVFTAKRKLTTVIVTPRIGSLMRSTGSHDIPVAETLLLSRPG